MSTSTELEPDRTVETVSVRELIKWIDTPYRVIKNAINGGELREEAPNKLLLQDISNWFTNHRPDLRIRFQKLEQVRKAYEQLREARRTGVIEKGPFPCDVCGNPLGQGHHEDYSKPLELRWLCARHHVWYHKFAKAGKVGSVDQYIEQAREKQIL
jgi:hypothetical protein